MSVVVRGDVMYRDREEALKGRWNDYRPKYRKHIENLICGLFRDKPTPFFDKKQVPHDSVVEFSKNEEAQFAAFSFIQELKIVWKKQFSGKFPLKELELPRQNEIKKWEPEVFNQNKPTEESQNHASINSPQTTINADLNIDSESKATGLKPGQVPSENTMPTKKVTSRPPDFHLPNCKVGVNYSGKIEGKDTTGKIIQIMDVRFLEQHGLAFDVKTQTISGKPKEAGEFDLSLLWRYAGEREKASGICKLISNPDPRSLWNVLEPANDLPYRKSHSDQKLVQGNGFRIAAASRRGRSHEHGGTFRDDDFFISDDPATGWSVLIVADGAGSAKSSREGSRLAVAAAGEYMRSHLTEEFGDKMADLLATWDDPAAQETVKTKFHYFFFETAKLAVQAIEQEAQNKNAQPKDYSTTLLAAAIRREGAQTFLATFWMGDGAISAYGPHGKVRLMGTPDGGEFAGQTRFLDKNALADQDFGKRISIGKWQDISAILLMTDGVSDPYFETDNGLANPAKWDALWDEINPLLNDATSESKLLEWLHFFKPGHHDDRTIALLW
jgi:hypothetical protein